MSPTAEPRRWLLLLLVSAALLPVAVDQTILFVAMPVLIHELGASGPEVLWIVDIYPLLMTGLVLASGPLGDRFGQRRVLCAGLAVFGLASAQAAFAPTAAWLVAGRALLAVGGALISPSSLAIVRQSFADPRERATAIGIWGAVAAGGAALGPLAGGLLLEHFWWGAVFLINVPLAALLLGVMLRLLPATALRGLSRLPFLSPLLGVVGIIALVYAVKTLAYGGAVLEIAAAALLALLLLTLFARRELRAAEPVFDFRLFAQPRIRIGVVAALLPVAVLVGLDLLFSQQLQFVQGLTPLQAGLVLLPASLAAFVAAPLAGHMLERFGFRRVAVLALLVAAAGYALLTLALPQAALALVLPALALMGLGHGVIMTAASDAVMSGAPESQAGRAAAIESVAYELGAGLGIAGFGSAMALLYGAGLPEGLPGHAARSVGEALLLAETLPGLLGEAVAAAARDAYAGAFRSVTLLSAVLMTLFAALIWWALAARRRSRGTGPCPRPCPPGSRTSTPTSTTTP